MFDDIDACHDVIRLVRNGLERPDRDIRPGQARVQILAMGLGCDPGQDIEATAKASPGIEHRGAPSEVIGGEMVPAHLAWTAPGVDGGVADHPHSGGARCHGLSGRVSHGSTTPKDEPFYHRRRHLVAFMREP
jgi:hypothetical protein